MSLKYSFTILHATNHGDILLKERSSLIKRQRNSLLLLRYDYDSDFRDVGTGFRPLINKQYKKVLLSNVLPSESSPKETMVQDVFLVVVDVFLKLCMSP